MPKAHTCRHREREKRRALAFLQCRRQARKRIGKMLSIDFDTAIEPQLDAVLRLRPCVRERTVSLEDDAAKSGVLRKADRYGRRCSWPRLALRCGWLLLRPAYGLRGFGLSRGGSTADHDIDGNGPAFGKRAKCRWLFELRDKALSVFAYLCGSNIAVEMPRNRVELRRQWPRE